MSFGDSSSDKSMSRRSIGEGNVGFVMVVARESGVFSRCNLQLLFSTSDFIFFFFFLKRRRSRRFTENSECNDPRREIAFCNEGCVCTLALAYCESPFSPRDDSIAITMRSSNATRKVNLRVRGHAHFCLTHFCLAISLARVNVLFTLDCHINGSRSHRVHRWQFKRASDEDISSTDYCLAVLRNNNT